MLLSAETEAWEALDAAGRVALAGKRYGDKLILSTSFGVQAAVMLHLVTRQMPNIPVVFIDTGYLFAETYRYAEELTQRLELNLKVYQPRMTAARQEALYGRRWEGGLAELEAYNLENKVEPMNRAVIELGAQAWLTGLRRSQARTRAELPVVQRQQRMWKIHPIVDWTEKQVYDYMRGHNLPFHPLWEKGYVSVGDWHSTAPLRAGMEAEATRFNGIKRECGLHEANRNEDWQI